PVYLYSLCYDDLTPPTPTLFPYTTLFRSEKDAMVQKPRAFTRTFFSASELSTSVLQGLVIAVGTLLVYQWSVQEGYTEGITRTIDRKSTRLNSSHVKISYAVFCLKKKKCR